MALIVGQLAAKLGLDSKDFDKGLGRAKGLLSDVTKQALGVAAGMAGFQGLQSAIESTVGAGIKWNMMLETSAAKWETLLGTQEAAKAQLAWMADFAAQTPFEFEELDRAAGRAKAFGFEIGYINSTLLPALGDAAAATGTGAEGIDRLTASLGQMQAKTKVSAEEMLQLTEMGIPAWQMLADSMGLTVPKLMDMVSKGLVPSSKAIPAIVDGMNKAFGGAMQKQAETFTGRLSTLKDNAKQLLGDAFKPAFEWLSKTALPLGISLVDKMAAGFREGGLKGAILAIFNESTRKAIANIWDGIKVLGSALWQVGKDIAPAAKAALGGLISVLGATFGWIKDNGNLVRAIILGILAGFMAFKAVQTVLQLVAAAQWALNAAMNANPIGIIIGLIGLLVAAGYLIVKNWDTIKRVALNAWGTIKKFIFEMIAKIVDKYADFIGIFSDSMAAEARAKAAALRQMAADEQAAIDQRNDMANEAAQEQAKAEMLKQKAAEQAAEESTQAWQGAAQAEQAAQQQSVQAVEDATGEKVEYLDEFTKAWEQNTEDAKTAFERAQEDATDTFKAEQEERLEAFKAAQEQQKTEFERAQEDAKTAFVRTLEDETTAFERALEDRKEAFERGLEDEKRAFERAQQEELDAFKRRQREELDVFKAAQDEKRAALDSEYRAKLDAIKAQQDAIRQQAEAEEAAKREAGLRDKVTKAEQVLAAARATANPAKVAAAEAELVEARQALQEYLTDQARKAELERLDQQAEALRKEWDQKKDALEQQQEAEKTAFEQAQAARLAQETERLEAEKTAFEVRLENRKTQFERELAAEKEAWDRAQEDRLTRFEREQEDAKTQFEAKLAEALAHFQRMQEEEAKAWDRAMEDRKTRFERELAADKEHYARRLDEQRRYVAQAEALADRAKAAAREAAAAAAQEAATRAAAAAAASAGSAMPDTSSKYGNNGVGTAEQMAANEARLKSDPAFVAAEKKRAADVIAARKAAGMDTSVQEAYLQRLNKMAEGGITTRATVTGEVRPEVVAPLSTLWARMAGLARQAAQQAVNAAGGTAAQTARAAAAAAGQGNGGGSVNIQVLMDGRQVARATVPHIPGVLHKVGVRG